jgi:hypothetical protein
MTPQTALAQTYASQYDAIARTMKGYLDGVREGKSELMRPAFHPAATFFGHYPGGVMNGNFNSSLTGLTRMARLLTCNLVLPACKFSARLPTYTLN